jgi:hypothetical protein
MQACGAKRDLHYSQNRRAKTRFAQRRSPAMECMKRLRSRARIGRFCRSALGRGCRSRWRAMQVGLAAMGRCRPGARRASPNHGGRCDSTSAYLNA